MRFFGIAKALPRVYLVTMFYPHCLANLVQGNAPQLPHYFIVQVALQIVEAMLYLVHQVSRILVLWCLVLFVLSCLVLSCLVLSCLVLCSLVLSCLLVGPCSYQLLQLYFGTVTHFRSFEFERVERSVPDHILVCRHIQPSLWNSKCG